jgi:hypothetical protein
MQQARQHSEFQSIPQLETIIHGDIEFIRLSTRVKRLIRMADPVLGSP